MIFKGIQTSTHQFLSNNASTILTAGGVVGTVATAVLTGKATFKAAEIIHEEEIRRIAQADRDTMGLSTFTKVKLVGPQYIPPIIVGGLTIASIVMANKISASRAAALAAAYGVTQKQFEEYKAKVAEKLTGPKKTSINDELAQDRVTNTPNREVIILADGEVLCFDQFTGRYFRSSVERIRKAEQTINRRLATCAYASLTEFYDEIGLPPTTVSDTVGWSMLDQDQAFEIQLSTVMTPDEKPCIAIDFNVLPKPDYTRTY